MAELEPLVALLEQQQAEAVTDATLASSQFELGRLVLLRLHTLMVNGDVAVDGASKELFLRVVAATSGNETADRSLLVLQIGSLRSLFGDWRQAVAELQPLTVVVPHRLRALLQIYQIYASRRMIADAWPVLEAAEHSVDTSTPLLTQASLLRYRAALLTLAGMFDGAADALAALRSLPLDEKKPTHAKLRLDAACTGFDLLLAAERYEEALVQAEAVANTPTKDQSVLIRARLGMALANVRLGKDTAALPLLTELAAAGSTDHGRRATIELALLALRANQPAVARQHLAAAHGKPLELCDEHELNALAWTTLTDLATGVAPFVDPTALRSALRAKLEWHFVQWEAIPPTVSGVAFLQLGVRRDLLAALCALTMHLDRSKRGVEECLDYILATEARGSTARSHGITAKRFAEVRATVVPTNGTLLVYLPALSASFVFVVTATEMAGIRLDPDVRLRRDVRHLRESVGSPTLTPLPELRAAADVVADWCLPSTVRAAIADRDELAIVGRELATGLPFELMPWQGTWLGCAKAVWNVPSMTLEHAAAMRAPVPRSMDVAVLAATSITEEDAAKYGVTPIPIGAGELTDLAAAVATPGTIIIAPATRAELLRGIGASAKVAVVVAHGVTDPARLRPYGLLLGTAPGEASGALFADDITSAAEVLLLGSCQLGRGSSRRGEDGGHRIGGAFLQAGARAVVLGDGDLGLAPTLVLAQAFVRELAGGATTAVALQRARRATAATPGFEHPWFHSQVRLEGAGQWRVALAPSASAPASRWWFWLPAGLFAFCAAIATIARVIAARRRAAN